MAREERTAEHLDLPTPPTRPGQRMSLEHMAAYEKDFERWEKQVLALIKSERGWVGDKVSLLGYRRKSPIWEGW
jgi:hypothetical protein